MPAYTADECREFVIDHLRGMARYWASLGKPPREVADGMVFSFLVMLDGGAMSLPAFDLVPSPHPDDKQYHRENGEKWWPRKVINESAQMHEEYCTAERKATEALGAARGEDKAKGGA